jgi:hypothetical protein
MITLLHILSKKIVPIGGETQIYEVTSYIKVVKISIMWTI